MSTSACATDVLIAVQLLRMSGTGDNAKSTSSTGRRLQQCAQIASSSSFTVLGCWAPSSSKFPPTATSYRKMRHALHRTWCSSASRGITQPAGCQTEPSSGSQSSACLRPEMLRTRTPLLGVLSCSYEVQGGHADRSGGAAHGLISNLACSIAYLRPAAPATQVGLRSVHVVGPVEHCGTAAP